MSNDHIPRDPKILQEWIKFQLRLRGYSLAALGRELSVGRTAPALVFYKHYPRMEKAIAKKLELDPVDIWPERYGVR